MDDDLGVPRALAVVHETVRAGNTALDDGDHEDAAAIARVGRRDDRGARRQPARPRLVGRRRRGRPTPSRALDALVEERSTARAQARAARDFATADAIRDRLAAAGIAIEDTPPGPAGRSRAGRSE